MISIIKRVSLALLLSAIFIAGARAQSTYTAASCSQSDVKAAINSQTSNPADGDVIVIPSGSCTWTGTTALSASFTKSVTIQGAGAISSTTGGAGITGSDLTIITDNLNRPAYTMHFTIAAGKSLRITALAILTDGNSSAPSAGTLNISGTQTSTVRVDHCHFNVRFQHLWFDGATVGVVDHNYFESPSGTITNDLVLWNGYSWNGYSYGDGAWADDDHWGTNQFMFIEDNRFYNGSPIDSHNGSRYVFRHNTVTVASASYLEGQIFGHGITNDRSRSGRASEVYGNSFVQPGSGATHPAFSLNGGTLLFWGNTITKYSHGMQLDYTRKDNASYAYGSPQSGWGNCTGSGGAVWDNTGGYPCMDGPARGVGDLLSGYPISSTVNVRKGTQAWPQQAISPIYVWSNTFTPTSGYDNTLVYAGTSMITANREYYSSVGASCSGDSCSTGIGSGLVSARPPSCTIGVGYWATDENKLYVCSATNTWSSYYTPYAYPHPLTQTGFASPPNLRIVSQ